MIVYKSYQNISDAVRRNVWKVPQGVALIVGVPRSGMIAALMVAEVLNVPCADIDAFAEGRQMAVGNSRRKLMRPNPDSASQRQKVLVIDDTVNKGYAMRRARQRLQPLQSRYDITFACVYARGRDAKDMVDVWFEDIYRPDAEWYLYEWNILHHHGSKTKASMWDIDGVVCKNPPSERDTEAYEAYLPHAVPMVVPTTTVGAFVTYRLEKYRKVTEQWLTQQGITYKRLVMSDAPDRKTRKQQMSPAEHKARHYAAADWARLFVESDPRQAEQIALLSGKPVYCYENGKLYN